MRKAISSFYVAQNGIVTHNGVDYPVSEASVNIGNRGFGGGAEIMAFSVMYSIPIAVHAPESSDPEQYSFQRPGVTAMLLCTSAWHGKTRNAGKDHWQLLDKIRLSASAERAELIMTGLTGQAQERLDHIAHLRNVHSATLKPPSLDPTKNCIRHGGSLVEDGDAFLFIENWKTACEECTIDDELEDADMRKQFDKMYPLAQQARLRRQAFEKANAKEAKSKTSDTQVKEVG